MYRARITVKAGGFKMLTQESYQEQLRQIEEAGRNFDRVRVGQFLTLIGERIEQGHPQANILACLYEFAKGVMEMIPVFEAHPEWALTNPIPDFTPVEEQSVRDLVDRQLRNAKAAAKRKQAILA